MKYTAANIKMWARMGQRGAVFGVALPEIAARQDRVKLLTADLALLSGMERYTKKYPDQFLNLGIAEQNMIGVAAGLAMDGYRVFASTYASFIAVRSLEQVRQNLAHMRCDVKLIGSSAGTAAAKSGISHWATEDLAFIRALPNLTVFSPADSLEAIKTTEWAADMEGPVYIRLSGGLSCPIVYEEDYAFEPGRLMRRKEGRDVAVIATGLMVSESLKAAAILEERGISCSVYNMHTLKPIDREGLAEIFSRYGLVVTVEEHMISGGLGSAVAEYKATLPNTPRQVFLGFQDAFCEAGTQRYVWEQAELTDVQIADRIAREWERKA